MSHLSPVYSRCKFFRLFLLVVLISVLMFSAVQAQTIRYVKPDGTGNGNSWATASANLQTIINASSAGDQVWVAVGTYKPGGSTNNDRTVSFSMKEGVAIYGSFTGTENALSERPASVTSAQPSSMLSGELGATDNLSDNINNIFINSDLSSAAVLDGFTVTGSYVLTNGGGMLNQNSSPTLRNCYFLTNSGSTASLGGGMYNDATSDPTLINCTFAGNTAQQGGAIFSQAGNKLTITSCTFSNNSALEGGGAIAGGLPIIYSSTFTNNIAGPSSSASRGGAINTSKPGSISIVNCLFSANEARGYGGAIHMLDVSLTLTNCTFRGNKATDGGGIRYGSGGAIYINTLLPGSQFTNCSFSNNIAKGLDSYYAHGGAVFVNKSDYSLTNCSFGSNSADGRGGAIFSIYGFLKLTNCVIWGNTPNGIISNTSLQLTYTNTQDNTPGTGNFSLDPLFVDVAGDNLQLQSCSSAIDKGNNSANQTTTDLDNSPRLVRQIDLGPYEFQGTPLLLVAVTKQPDAYFSIPEGGTLTTIVSVSGSVGFYQWYRDGTPISGATSATLTVSNLSASDAGHYYVVVTGTCNTTRSAELTLVVNTGMYSVKAGRWDDASVWSLGRVPVAGEAVRIKHLVSVPVGYVAQVRQLSYDPGQRLRLESGSKVGVQ